MCTIITYFTGLWTKLKEHTAKFNAFLSVIIYSFTELWTKLNEDTTELNSFLNCVLRRLQNSRFRKAGSAVRVILECEARESLSPFSLAVFSLAPAFRSNMVRRSRSQKIRLFCSLHFDVFCDLLLNQTHGNMESICFI